MTPDERWLAAVWPFVRDSLPAAPARVAAIDSGLIQANRIQYVGRRHSGHG